MRYMLIVFVLTALPLPAQIILLSGGDSSIQNGFGGQATAYFPNSTSSVGAGEVNGRLAYSALDTFAFHGDTISVGQTPFGFQVAGSGAYVMETGVQVRRDSSNQTIAGFVGSTGLGASVVPFFTAGLTQHIGAGLFYRRKIKQLDFSNLSVLDGGQRTQIDGVDWQGAKISASAAGGLLMGSRFANGQMVYRPSHALNLYAFRQDSFVYIKQAYEQFTNNSVGLSVNFDRYTLGANINQGSYQGKTVFGEAAHAGVKVSILSFNSGAYLSAGRSTVLFHSLMAQVTRRFSVQGTIAQDLKTVQQAGSTSYGGGFAWNTNRWTLSFSQSIAFAPWLNGYSRVSSATITFKVPHTDATINSGFYSGAIGNKFALGGQEYIKGPMSFTGGPADIRHYSSGGKYIVSGLVVDDKGDTVAGATLRIGKFDVVSDSSGHFELRTKKAQSLTLTVLTEEFPVGEWVIVSAPASVTPALSGEPLTITVRRK